MSAPNTDRKVRTMRLEKRVQALEARMLDPVILYFAEGSTREICGRADYLLRLFCATATEGSSVPGTLRNSI